MKTIYTAPQAILLQLDEQDVLTTSGLPTISWEQGEDGSIDA